MGIVHQITLTKTPQQNGVVERFNRTLFGSVRSMIEQAKLPDQFLADAVVTACFIRICCLNSAKDVTHSRSDSK